MSEKVLKVQRADLAVEGLVAQRVMLAFEGDHCIDWMRLLGTTSLSL